MQVLAAQLCYPSCDHLARAPRKHLPRWSAARLSTVFRAPRTRRSALQPPCRRTAPSGPGRCSAELKSSSRDPSTPAVEPWLWERSGDGLRTYAALAAVLALGSIPALRSQKLADLPYFISLAVITIYVGSHRGLGRKDRQSISLKEGALAPLFASAALFGGYLLVKFFPDLSIEAFLNAYFWLIGSIAVAGAAGAPLRRAVRIAGLGSWLGQQPGQLMLPSWLQKEDGTPIGTVDVAPSDLLALALGLAAATADVASGHTNFSLNNLLACCIATDLLQLIGLRSFRVAAVLLCGLLAYDVFWVFASPKVVGDNVMLTVATSNIIAGPTRLLFPRFAGGGGEASDFPFSLLGLGDIAVPGLLAGLALRYDASRAVDMNGRAQAAGAAMHRALALLKADATSTEAANAAVTAAEAAFDSVADAEDSHRDDFQGASSGAVTASDAASDSSINSAEAQRPAFLATESVMQQRTYFGGVMVAYVLGLAVAFAANAITGLGQPALLYLVPLTLGSVALTAATRGDVQRILEFKDSAPDAK